uniref:Uncharacterized protein n=1 Tax=Triticum urartu TaxID=4572 RepID=A0A8R7U530_TRIUA
MMPLLKITGKQGKRGENGGSGSRWTLIQHPTCMCTLHSPLSGLVFLSCLRILCHTLD